MSWGKSKTANTNNNSWSESKIDQMILLAILLFMDSLPEIGIAPKHMVSVQNGR